MWIVKLALKRPYTFVVMALLIFLLGIFTIEDMPTDIFPAIDIPVVAIVWSYNGLDAKDMEQRVTSIFERALTTTVNNIEHIESQTLVGVSVVKVFLHPGASVDAATAQVTAVAQSVLKLLPPGITPPQVHQYSASDVPIIQGSVHSDTLPEQTLFDLTLNFGRTALATVEGAQLPSPYGGKIRQVMIDINSERMYALGLSPDDVSAVLSKQNLVFPSGTIKLGKQEVAVTLNSSPDTIQEIAALPLKTHNGGTVLMSDIAQVRDGFAPQTSIVRNSGRRGVLMTILKSGAASTLDVIEDIREVIPKLLATLPPAYKIDLLFDQSVFVRASVEGVIKEATIAALLTAMMILLFLGSWRSTLIVIVSIPLSILVSIIVLSALGHTLNLMTLGGLSLAVGILVDDATVEIENVHRNIAQRKPLVRAILDGAQQIAAPALVATLCICIVFIPVVFIAGAARSLFTPLAMAVVFAMLTSYLLSRTLVPTMVHFLLRAELHRYTGVKSHKKEDIFWRAHQQFNILFERTRRRYGGFLDWALEEKRAVSIAFLTFSAISCVAFFPFLGRDFFPTVDAGQARLHVRCPPGTRIEETEKTFAMIEKLIREVIPEEELSTVIDNMGVPVSGLNLALGDPSMISAADGEILIALNAEKHAPTAQYVKILRERLEHDFPEVTVFFLAPDITTQVLNFGLSAPIDVQLVGPLKNQQENLRIAMRVREEMKKIKGAVDVHLQQVVSAPSIKIDIDRVEASEQRLDARDIAADMLVALSSSGQVHPNYWVDPSHAVQYLVAVQTPQYELRSMDALLRTPVGPAAPSSARSSAQMLGNVATLRRNDTPVNITHYNIAQTLDVLANVQGTDLGSVALGVQKVIDKIKPTLPRGSTMVMRGQVDSMNASFRGLAFGIIFAVVLVYFLMVVNFQSWLDPFIILTALPGAVAGICWMLYATATTLSVPALMGAIMSIGVATSNSILMVTFANDQRAEGVDARRAAWLAGITRLRPVMMTALAMILGMLPMSLGLGEGGEQNAPLGRAVIGGLCVATFATLFFVPVVYSVLRKAPPRAPLAEEDM